MARIDFVETAHTYEGSRDWALKPMTMTWNDGGAYALLGPSGCGKTTLLNIISGLITPTQGAVLFDQREVTALAPEARNIAQVFQFPVVYDTMTVFDNLAFPLRNRAWKRNDVRRRVHEVAEILELTADLETRARSLPADLKQKISLGRGLVRPDVAAVLFDEPLTVIDPHLKWLLRRKLRQIHQQLKLSLIYVTHDQTEALTFADQVVVMTQGEVVQVGSPEALFETPAHRFVGHFIGSPGMNFIRCERTGRGAQIANTPIETSSRNPPPAGGDVYVGVRPEYLTLHEAGGPNRIRARVIEVQDQGVHVMTRLEANGAEIWAKTRDRFASQGEVWAHLPAHRSALYVNDLRIS